LTRWESGVLMEFVRFDDYYKGKPPLDTVFVRFIADENAAVASLLAGQIDVIPPVGIDLDLAQQVKERWEGTGNRVGGKLSGGLKIIEMQHRAEFARPGGGLNTTPVRQAFYHALDRAQLAEVLTHGNAQAADSWFFPGHPLRPQVESSISPFPYDPARALRLLTDAGWTRASEALVRRDTAERFEVELSGTRDDTKAVAIIANYWRSLGVVVDETPITSDRQADLEQLARSPGAWLTTPRFYQLFTDRYHSRSAPTAATRWTGRNRGGYSNPRVDAVLDQLVRTIPPAERLPLHRELLREQGGDLAVMPLYWEYDPFLQLRGVRGITTGGAWNFVEWDKE
jgi:peptide/nickel transport system substrate-binding protein